jgi:predicted nucleic-acid-binding protein
MSKEYSDSDYYWEKAEFQDPVSHRAHVENYKKGIRDSIAFDAEYAKEAEMELKGE